MTAKPIKRIRCHSSAHAYDIVIGGGILVRVPEWIRGARGFLIADKKLALPARKLARALAARGFEIGMELVSVSEDLKSLRGIAPLYEKLERAKLSRDDVLFVLGGGALGDAAGFVAATYLRGIRWVMISSTLLGQVDSAIGGKTALNSAHGKNRIGAIHAPSLVVCDLELLRSLPRRDIVSGLGEILKYGLVFDAKFFHWLEANWQDVLKLRPDAVAYAVSRAALRKARIVSRDEYEHKDERILLNFGHTVGHALEAATGYHSLRHGEAVIYGMRAALLLSLRMGVLMPRTYLRIETLLRAVPLPPLPPSLDIATVLSLLASDKKRRDGRLRFILLSGIGRPLIALAPAEALLKDAVLYAVAAHP